MIELSGKSAIVTGAAHGIGLAKDLGNTPSNVCTPEYLAKEAQKVAKTYGFDLRVAVRAGNRVTLVYGGDRWSRTGVAVAIVNMDTREVAVDVLQARRIASRYSLLRAAFWGLGVAAVGATADMAFGMFTFTLAGLALGFVATLSLAFAWQWSLWANIQARIRPYANGLAAEV